MTDDMNVEDVDFEEMFKEPPKKPKAKVTPVGDIGGDIDEFLADVKPADEQEAKMLTKPWMKFHEFILVKTIEEVKALVDAAIKHGRCSLDLETEGLDNRIDYDGEGRPYTRHKIVGYCISVKGVGHYLPLRHKYDKTYKQANPNLPIEETDAEIKRLCLAAQPVIAEDAPDQYASPKFEKPPQLVIYFWHAKFDQEFLYPVTGIHFWHPDSFEDGMLSTYVLYTDDVLSLKVNAKERLKVQDPETGEVHPYEMIEFTELFQKGTPKRFANLYPRDGTGMVLYACSDAICTELLCEAKKVVWKHTVEGLKYEYKSPVGPSHGPKFRGILRIEKQAAQAVREMERSRTLVDKDAIEDLLEEAYKEKQEFEEKLVMAAKAKGFEGFNPSSTAQLSDFLFTKRGLDLPGKPEKNEASGQYKTDAKTLEAIYENNQDIEVLRWVVMYRQIDKTIGTYLTKLSHNTDEFNQLRFNFQQTGAGTGRFTAPQGKAEEGFAAVPIHGIPARSDPKRPKVANSLRRLFVAHEGYVIVKVDYAGQELRVVTCITKEPKWRKEFLEGTGDLHTLTAQAFFGDHITKNHKKERTCGKIANFALIYGGGVGAVQRAVGCDKVEAARKKEAFDASVPTFSSWVKSQHRLVKKNKYVTTGFGRYISVPDANIKAGEYTARTKKHPPKLVDEKTARKIRASCERQSTNFPVQGCNFYASLVNTRKGWVKIGELCGSGETFSVWTGTRWADATAHDMGGCELANVYLTDGTTVRCDTRHKLLVVSDQGYDWVDYQDLEPGMAVATSLCEQVEYTPPPLPLIEHRPNTKDMESLWYWLGRYVGDSWFSVFSGTTLQYSFGDHEKEAIEACRTFWEKVGVSADVGSNTHTPCREMSTRCTVTVQSRELHDWLKLIGLKEGATTHTKRAPSRVFSETLANRKAFLRGVVDSGGHEPKLPKKINGVRETSKKGNPYNIHLCQRPLLEDLKLLFRSVGVESVIRDRNGCSKATTNYRLDPNRRMYERNVMGRKDVHGPKFHDMDAPQFLVDDFLSHGPFPRKAFQGDESAYTLHKRLQVGGKVTVYALKRLCTLLDVVLNHPIYGFKRIVSKENLGTVEHTYTLSVQDPLHRFEADGVITKNSGADMLKISFVKLIKVFHRKGWLRDGGDDSVRMIMTVHDEIVFEVRKDRLMEAIPEITRCMESPPRLRKWDIPFYVEPLIGESWDAKYDWEDLMAGKTTYFHSKEEPDKPVPQWLLDLIEPQGKDWRLPFEDDLPPPKSDESVAPVVKDGALVAQKPAQEVLKPSTRAPAPKPVPQPPEVAVEGSQQMAVFAISSSQLTRQSIRIVSQVIKGAEPFENEKDLSGYKILQVVDETGYVLISAKWRVLVDPDIVGREFALRNLGPGNYDIVTLT
jgi:DNA polymerase I-like protein with 3'-5' exonuclease and polymerase domains